ncbi:MAG: hypothetical protein JJT90_16665 [Ectothiorhodospiraceae bacterium]|nr:hypothetical protein [Ectothiorhodospiraceae bacterium]
MTTLKLRELLMTLLIALGLSFGSAGVAMAGDWGDDKDTTDDYETIDQWDDDDDDDDDEEDDTQW